MRILLSAFITLVTCFLSADVQYNLDGVSRLEGIMGCFNALGTIAFGYGGHNVVLEIQA